MYKLPPSLPISVLSVVSGLIDRWCECKPCSVCVATCQCKCDTYVWRSLWFLVRSVSADCGFFFFLHLQMHFRKVNYEWMQLRWMPHSSSPAPASLVSAQPATPPDYFWIHWFLFWWHASYNFLWLNPVFTEPLCWWSKDGFLALH